MLEDVLAHTGVHVALAATAAVIAVCCGCLLGVLAHERPQVGRPVRIITGGLRGLPSMAVLMLMIPWLGVGAVPAVVAIALLATAPVLLATEAGLSGVDPRLLEEGRALGMDPFTLRRRIVWPLAFPVVLGGMRTAIVEAIAGATLAAFIGGGGLGEYILEGLAAGDTPKLLLGGGIVAVLAWSAEFALGRVQRRMA